MVLNHIFKEYNYVMACHVKFMSSYIVPQFTQLLQQDVERLNNTLRECQERKIHSMPHKMSL